MDEATRKFRDENPEEYYRLFSETVECNPDEEKKELLKEIDKPISHLRGISYSTGEMLREIENLRLDINHLLSMIIKILLFMVALGGGLTYCFFHR